MFRAPEWSVNDRSLWALDVLVEEGFRLDASMAPLTMVGSVTFPRHPHVRHDVAGPIVEVPPLVADRFGQVMPLGWGWGLRMSSPRRVLDAIERLNHRGQPAVLTVHPWEIDPDPPRVRLPARLALRALLPPGGFADRLRTILSGGHFGPIGRIGADCHGRRVTACAAVRLTLAVVGFCALAAARAPEALAADRRIRPLAGADRDRGQA